MGFDLILIELDLIEKLNRFIYNEVLSLFFCC